MTVGLLVQVFVPLMYGRTEAESSGPRGGLKPLSDLAKLLLPRPDDGDGALEEKSGGAGAVDGDGDGGAFQRQSSLAPWSLAVVGSGQQERQRRDIVLVQGPAGSGKSLFAWSLYSRFGQPPCPNTCYASMQTPRLRLKAL